MQDSQRIAPEVGGERLCAHDGPNGSECHALNLELLCLAVVEHKELIPRRKPLVGGRREERWGNAPLRRSSGWW